MDPDEEALRWEGDELDAVTEQPTRRRSHSSPAPNVEGAPLALRIVTFVLALAATAGWIVIVVANPVEQPSLVALAMYELGELLAVLGPTLAWFVVDRVAPLKRKAPLWLVALVLTAPWPLVAGVLT